MKYQYNPTTTRPLFYWDSCKPTAVNRHQLRRATLQSAAHTAFLPEGGGLRGARPPLQVATASEPPSALSSPWDLVKNGTAKPLEVIS